MTFNINLDKIFDNIKKLWPLAFALGSTTGFILFVPENIHDKLHISDLPEIWYTVFGISFIISIFFLSFAIFQTVFSLFKKEVLTRLTVRKLKHSYESLNSAQKAIICEMLQSREKYLIMSLYNGNARLLVSKKFIYYPQQTGILLNNNEIAVRYYPHPWLVDEYNRDSAFFLKNR